MKYMITDGEGDDEVFNSFEEAKSIINEYPTGYRIEEVEE